MSAGSRFRSAGALIARALLLAALGSLALVGAGWSFSFWEHGFGSVGFLVIIAVSIPLFLVACVCIAYATGFLFRAGLVLAGRADTGFS